MFRTGMILAFLMVSLAAAGCHDAGAGDALEQESLLPGLEPGGSITLSAPPEGAAQLAQSTSDPITDHDPIRPEGFRSDLVGDRIGIRARALIPFQPHGGKVYRYWDFEIPAESSSQLLRNRRFPTVLQAQISGAFKLRGFLFVAGWGKASVSLDLTLFDRGTANNPIDPPKPIYGANLTEHVLDPTLGLGAEVEVQAEAGAPYVGLGGGFAVGFDTPIEIDLVRDEMNFGFQSLVQRGHQYRVQIDLTAEARQAAAPGFPAMSFFMAGRADPDNTLAQVDPTTDSENAELGDALDPDFWIEGIHALMEARFPLLTRKGLNAFPNTPRFYFPEVTVEYFGDSKTWGDQFVSVDNFPGVFLPTLVDTAAALAAVSADEIPGSLEQLIRNRLATRGSQTQDTNRETIVDRPGLEFPDGITVTLATDTVEEVAKLLKQQ